jgi:carbonic anhydrase/acetyltransferase-like protein (isoleucine patch superfamily)
MMTHGNVVIDGRTRIGKHCQINPWVTIGLSNSKKLGFSADGPTIGDEVHIGTGAKILGPVTVGDHARIGANAVVIHDVPANTTVVGAPARAVGRAERSPGVAGNNGKVSDEELIACVRQAIVDYKLKRRSLESLLDLMLESVASGSRALAEIGTRHQSDLWTLRTAGSDPAAVDRSLAAIETSLTAPALPVVERDSGQ